MPIDSAGNKYIAKHDFSSTLHRWAQDYFNSVNILVEKHNGLALFPVKYNNACLAFEMTMKSYIAYKNRASSPEEIDKLMKSFGHSIMKLIEHAKSEMTLVLSDEDESKLIFVDSFYKNHLFRYPPAEPRKLQFSHTKLLDAINALRDITAVLLAITYEQTNGFSIPDNEAD